MRDAPDILCIGALHWDVLGVFDGRLRRGDDVPGQVRRRPGGVAHNLAAALAGLGLRPALLSAVGADDPGRGLLTACAAAGIDCTHVACITGTATDSYLGIEDAHGLMAAIAGSALLEASGAEVLAPLLDGRMGQAERPFRGPVMLDSGLSGATLAALAASPALRAARLWLVPAAPVKAARLRPFLAHPAAGVLCNLAEARALLGPLPDPPGATPPDPAAAARALCAAGAAMALVTNGAAPAWLALPDRVLSRAPAAVPAPRVTGAGDALAAAFVAATLRGHPPEAALDAALAHVTAHLTTGSAR